MKTRSVHVKESQLEPVVYSKLTLKPTLNLGKLIHLSVLERAQPKAQ